jgi:hypothetical protein
MLVKYCYLTGFSYQLQFIIQFVGQHHSLTKLLILKKY